MAFNHLTLVLYGRGVGTEIAANSHVLSKGDPSPPCSVLWCVGCGGGATKNVPSVPTFMRTVNGPKNVDQSNGDPSPPCSVIGGEGRSVIGPNSHDLSKGDPSPPCSVLCVGGDP